MQITAVDTEGPFEPRRWQDAAKVCVSSIFDSTAAIMADRGESRITLISSENYEKLNSELETFLLFQGHLDIQFEGMINTSKWFEADQMYWAEEWKILGAIAASGGMKNGSFLPDAAAGSNYKKMENLSASGTEVFDSWMIREQITETLIRKQHDYGHHNISRFGRHGLLVRVHDKIARLKNLMLQSAAPNNESISDTYTDIVGYSAIGIMWERGWFNLELTV
jgi:hypothetical protein